MSDAGASRPTPWLRVVAPVLGIIGMLVVAPFYLASGLMAPAWAVLLFGVVWLALAALAVVWFRRRPFLVLALPVIAIAVWFAGMSAGDAWLGWTP